jgi:hypothetical protein
MIVENQAGQVAHHQHDVPLPIVALGRWVYVVVLSAGLLLQQPWLTTAILLLVLPSVMWGRRWNLISAVGQRLYGEALRTAEREDRRLMRFNNLILVVLLGAAQIAFLAGAPWVAWSLTGMVIAAAALALAGFCVGCMLFYQLKLTRFRLFNPSR